MSFWLGCKGCLVPGRALNKPVFFGRVRVVLSQGEEEAVRKLVEWCRRPPTATGGRQVYCELWVRPDGFTAPWSEALI